MPEIKIKAALMQLHTGIKNSDGAAISAALGELEALLAAHGDSLPAPLAHFLAGRSYAKALAFLGGGEELSGKPATPPGGCGSKG